MHIREGVGGLVADVLAWPKPMAFTDRGATWQMGEPGPDRTIRGRSQRPQPPGSATNRPGSQPVRQPRRLESPSEQPRRPHRPASRGPRTRGPGGPPCSARSTPCTSARTWAKLLPTSWPCTAAAHLRAGPTSMVMGAESVAHLGVWPTPTELAAAAAIEPIGLQQPLREGGPGRTRPNFLRTSVSDHAIARGQRWARPLAHAVDKCSEVPAGSEGRGIYLPAPSRLDDLRWPLRPRKAEPRCFCCEARSARAKARSQQQARFRQPGRPSGRSPNVSARQPNRGPPLLARWHPRHAIGEHE